MVVSDGHFTLNNTEASGNVTVMEGSSVQTGNSGASIRLNSGAQVIFGADSRGTLAGDRLVLERGSAKTAGYSVRANHLNINVDHASSATIAVRGKAVEVAALTGNIHVFGASGVNVANLLAGDALTLEPEDSAAVSSVSSMTGCIRKSGASFDLTDETSKVTVVLHGSDLSAGKRVQVNGQIVDEPGSAIKGLNVQKVTVLSGGCKSRAKAAAAAAGAGGAAAGGVAGGVSGAVIAGVAVAGATAATAVAVTQSSSSSASTSSSSLSNGR